MQTPLRSVAAMNPSPAAGEGPEAAMLPRAGPRLPTVFHARLLTKARESWGFKAKSGFSAAVRVPPRRSASLQPTLPAPSTGGALHRSCSVPRAQIVLEWGKNHPRLVRGTGLAGEGEGLRDLGGKAPLGLRCWPRVASLQRVLGHQGPKSASCGGDGDVVAPGGAERGDPAALRPTPPAPWGTERLQGPRAHRSFCLPLVLLRLQIPHVLFLFFFFLFLFYFFSSGFCAGGGSWG